MRLLLVEDEEEVAETLAGYLQKQGYVVDRAPTLAIAREALQAHTFDLVLLDRMLPDGDGMALIAFAGASQKPQRFLVLSALTATDDKVAALESGAVDYIGKPFEPRELVARIRNALRRGIDASREMKRIGPLSYEVGSGVFFIDDAPFVLRRTEALVLEALMTRPGVLVQRETLEARVYGYDQLVTANSLDAQISRLRKHLGERTAEIRIQVVRGIGYRIVEA